MHKTTRRIRGAVAAALLSLTLPAVAQDENYPSSPIRMVWGNPAGARGDLIARLLAQKLSAQLNTSVVVDNKPGASSNVGAEFVAKSRPDGYTLLFNPSSVILSRALGEKLGYDIFRDLAPIALFASGPQLLIVHPSVAASSVSQFTTYLKANPDKLAYGSAGNGSPSHLSILLFLQSNGVSALHVPYKGSPPAMLDLVAGRVQFGVVDVGFALTLMKDGRVKGLAITSLKRSPRAPDVPALAETMPGFEVGNWFGVMAPARTPRAIVQRLNGEVMKVVQDADAAARLLEHDVLPLGSTPDGYETYLKNELERWSKVIKTSGLKSENP